jgi:hypothetical protein
MHATQQVTHAPLERLIAMRAAQAAACSEIAERGRAESAALRVTLRSLHLLMNALEEVRDIGLRRGESRLHATLGRTPLAEVEQPHSTSLDFSELDDSVRFLADIAYHVSLTFLRRSP